jgi:tetratricopeptide (TPR) repeat protein
VEQLNEAGQRFFGAERYEEALDCANKALALDPRDATSLSRRANCFFLLGRGEDAVGAHERLLELHPGRIGSWLDKAVTEKRLGRDAQALRSVIDLLEVAQDDDDLARSARTLKKELESKKTRPAARSHLGWLALAHQAVVEGRLRDALEVLDRALALAPRDPELWRFKGDVLVERQQFDEGLHCYSEGLRYAPRDPQIWHAQGTALAQLRRFEAAVAAWDRAIEAAPLHAASWADRGKTLGVLKRYEEAVASLERAVALAPGAAAAWHDKALAEEALGRNADAARSLREFLEVATPEMDAEIAQARARLAALEGGAARAAAPAPPAAEDPPPAPAAIGPAEATVPKVVPSVSHAEALKRGESQLELGSFGPAIEWFDQAIVADQRAYSAWTGKAEALLALKRHAEAVAHFDKGLALNPRYVIGWQKRAAALEALGDDAAALDSWERALQLAPQNAILWHGRALAQVSLGRLEEALKSFEQALGRDPNLAIARFMKASAEDRLGRTAEAVTAYQEFVDLAPAHLGAQIQHARERLQVLRR